MSNGLFRTLPLLLLIASSSACGGAPSKPTKTDVRPNKPAEVKATPPPNPIAVHVCKNSLGGVQQSQVVRVEIRGPRVPALLCERFPVNPGDPLEPAATDATVRALFAEGRVEDVVVYKENQKDGAVVVYDLKIRRRVRSVKVRSVGDIEQSVADELVTDAPLWEDNARLDQLVREATATLSDRGYRRANITLETTPEGEDEVNVVLVVDPGPRIMVAGLEVEGFSAARWNEISALVRTKVGEPFNQELLERDVLVMTADLFDRGNVSAVFSTPEIVESADGSKVNIKLKVTEGPVFKVRQVKFVGDLVAPAPTYLREAWHTKSGSVFSRKSIVDDVESVKRFQVSRGASADVDIETALDPKSRSVDVTVRIKRRQ